MGAIHKMFESPVSWRKQGLLVIPRRELWWCRNYCMVPTPQHIKGSQYRIYFSGRDDQNRSHIGYVLWDAETPLEIINGPDEPVLSPGALGCFDDNGVTPSCVIQEGNETRLYYIGWNPGSTVRMHLFGGLAISTDGGHSFERWSRAPIIARCASDPYLNTAPWAVQTDDGWRLYYVSGARWEHKDLPLYNIKVGFSDDGKTWRREGHVCIDFKDNTEFALARPYVVFENGIWKMWFAHKGSSYRLGYAESTDGLDWHRRDSFAGLDVSDNGFDSEMIEYAAVIRHKETHFMFYNGNAYGAEGIGLAIETP